MFDRPWFPNPHTLLFKVVITIDNWLVMEACGVLSADESARTGLYLDSLTSHKSLIQGFFHYYDIGN